MAKPSTTGLHTPRPSALRSSSSSSCPSTRTSVGSTTSSSAPAAPKLPAAAAAAAPRDFASNAKVVAKCLAYDDDDDDTTLAATLSPDAVPEVGRLFAQEEDLAPLLELPDPDVSGDTSAISAAAPTDDDALITSADSCCTEVPAPAGSSEAPLPEEINAVVAELRGASGLSPRSKRLLAALAEAAAFELAPSPAARRLSRAAFWGKVRVAALAGTLAAVVAADVALGAYLYARRLNDRYHVLPPT